jgi:hypothetical protein
MKTITQELPKAQINIIIQALSIREQDLKRYLQQLGVTEEDSTAIQYELFDILVLKKMLAYKVEVSLTQPQHEWFTSVNGVDYPMYDIEPVIIDGVRKLSQIENDLLDIRLDLLEDLHKNKDENSLAQIESYDNEFINIVISFDLDESKNIVLDRNTMKVVSK